MAMRSRIAARRSFSGFRIALRTKFGAALALRRRDPLVGLVGLGVELVQVAVDLGHRLVGDVGELARDVRARHLDGLRLLVGLRAVAVGHLRGLVLLFFAGVDADHGPEVGGLVAVPAGGAGLDEALVVRVGVGGEVADVVVQVLGAVADAGLGDEVVGVEVAVLVAAAVDGEGAGRRAGDRPRVELVRLHLQDVDEEARDRLRRHWLHRCRRSSSRRRCRRPRSRGRGRRSRSSFCGKGDAVLGCWDMRNPPGCRAGGNARH